MPQFLSNSNNKDTDQPAHLRISDQRLLVIRLVDIITPTYIDDGPIHRIPRFYKSQAGLSLTSS